MIEVKAPQPVTFLLKEPPALSNPLPSWFGEQRKTEPVHLSIPLSFHRENKPLFTVSPSPDQSHPPVGSVLAFWPEMAAAASTVVSPRGRKLRNALLMETIARSISLNVACAPQPTVAPAITEQAPFTPMASLSTEVPTLTPTALVETPTTEASPTPTAPKEGDTKIVVENGKDVTYTYKIVTSVDSKEPLYIGWFKTLTPTALPTWDWDTYVPDGAGGYKWGKDIMPKQVLVEEGVPGAEVLRSLTHVQTPEGTVNNEDYMATLRPQVFKRYYDKLLTASETPTWQKLQQELQDGKPDTAQLTFTVSGKEYHWSPGPNVGTAVYIIKWNNAAPIEGNGFKEWEEPGLNHFRSVFWGVDAKGNIIGAISSQKSLKELTDLQIREMVLFHDISALYFKDLTNIGYSMPLYDFATTSGAESPPQIQINKNEIPAPTSTP